MSSPQTTTDAAAVVDAIRSHDHFLVTTHENPDGDALGSLLAMELALRQLGKDTVMFLGGPAPLPGEYRFLELPERGLRRERPPAPFARRARREAPGARLAAAGEAFLITPTALSASASLSKPKTAEYLPPTTWATRNAMLMPASAMARASRLPRPGRLSPATSRVGMSEGLSPACSAAPTAFPETGATSMTARLSLPGMR